MNKIIILSLFLFVLTIQAQNKYSFISADLHLMSQDELVLHQVQISEDTPMFNALGKAIESSQINELMRSGNFVPLVYGDKEHKAKAVVFRKLNAVEDKKKQEIAQNTQTADPNANFIAGKKASNFIAYDINGNKISLADLKGKIIVLNFWFTACKPCMVEIPKLNKLVDKYNKNVHFISITFDSKEQVTSFLNSTNFNYKHIVNNESILNDYDVNFFPTHIIIDKKGEIILRKVGDFIVEMDAKIEFLLK